MGSVQRLPVLRERCACLPREDDGAHVGHDEDGRGVGGELVVEVLGDVGPLVGLQARHLVEGVHDGLAEPALLGVDAGVRPAAHDPPKGECMWFPLADGLHET